MCIFKQYTVYFEKLDSKHKPSYIRKSNTISVLKNFHVIVGLGFHDRVEGPHQGRLVGQGLAELGCGLVIA